MWILITIITLLILSVHDSVSTHRFTAFAVFVETGDLLTQFALTIKLEVSARHTFVNIALYATVTSFIARQALPIYLKELTSAFHACKSSTLVTFDEATTQHTTALVLSVAVRTFTLFIWC
jgi:hypothetical protein